MIASDVSALDDIILRSRRSIAENYSTEDQECFSAVRKALDGIELSWSGSSLGYHARVYYSGFLTPPPGAHFNSEWGLLTPYMITGSTGDWKELASQEVIEEIYRSANVGNLDHFRIDSQKMARLFEEFKAEALSILITLMTGHADEYLNQIKATISQLKLKSKSDVVQQAWKLSPISSRDSVAVNQGLQIAPHVEIASDLLALYSPFEVTELLAIEVENALKHVKRQLLRNISAEKSTERTKVFIGHGNSPQWRELKDFISDELGLVYDEFNRVPIAGVTNKERLTQMLDQATVALILMTGEDETKDGVVQARQNVIHEVGLFQGRLGFTKAIVLVEDGCQEFSNIEGLGQIRYPKGQISAKFNEIRKTLVREGVIEK
jgi:predicted nucleotide-binding protein